jgi:hypothetical protein
LLDVAASYPNGEDTLNISRVTTWMELARIENVSDQQRRRFGINATAGHVNASEICREIYKMPSHSQVLKAYREHRKDRDAIAA